MMSLSEGIVCGCRTRVLNWCQGFGVVEISFVSRKEVRWIDRCALEVFFLIKGAIEINRKINKGMLN